jgi:Fe(3+) dicitrate transport protein
MSRPTTTEALAIALALLAPASARGDQAAPQTPDAKPAPKQQAKPPPPTPVDTAQAPDVTVTTDPEAEPADEGEVVTVEGRAPPGAKTQIGKEALERDEHNDIHKVLGGVAGVYLRDEDGYGLRPNIGMRGAAADRSSKITLMEDGVLIAPAPYTAPAAQRTDARRSRGLRRHRRR